MSYEVQQYGDFFHIVLTSDKLFSDWCELDTDITAFFEDRVSIVGEGYRVRGENDAVLLIALFGDRL